MNLEYARPFANTKDLDNMTPKIYSNLADLKVSEEDDNKYENIASSLEKDEEPVDGQVGLENEFATSARERKGKKPSRSDTKDAQEL